jgi:hypothetical protein
MRLVCGWHVTFFADVRFLFCDREAGGVIARLTFSLKKYKPSHRTLIGLPAIIFPFPFPFRTIVTRPTALVPGPIR